MDTNTASETLQNILNTCEKESVQFSFHQALLEQKLKTGICTVGKWISLLLLLLTFLSPLAFNHSPVIFRQVENNVQEFILDSHYVLNGNLYLQFYGDEVDPDKSYMITDSGARFTCSNFNAEKNTISFLYDGEGANIYIISKSGKNLHLLMTLRDN